MRFDREFRTAYAIRSRANSPAHTRTTRLRAAHLERLPLTEALHLLAPLGHLGEVRLARAEAALEPQDAAEHLEAVARVTPPHAHLVLVERHAQPIQDIAAQVERNRVVHHRRADHRIAELPHRGYSAAADSCMSSRAGVGLMVPCALLLHCFAASEYSGRNVQSTKPKYITVGEDFTLCDL